MSVYEILLPLILIVAAGFLTTKNGFFSRHFIGDVSKFVLYISLPAVIFGSVTQLDLSEAINKNYMLIYAVGGLLCMTIAVLYSRLIMKLKWQDCFINALGSGMPNSAFIGFPIVLSIFDGQYAEAFLMSVLIENLVFIPVCLVLLEFSNETDSSLKDQLIEIGNRLRKNPIIISITLALSINLLGIQMPFVIEESVGILAKTSVALALFAIGGILGQSLVLNQKSRIALVTSIKLVCFPIIALGLLLVWPVEGDLKYVLLIFCASPMLSIYPILGGIYKQQNFCANTLIITTLASAFTLSIVVSLITHNS